MIKRVLCGILVVLSVAACDRTTTQTVSNGGGAAGIQLVTLEDGTRCAAMVGYQKGGISCNWK